MLSYLLILLYFSSLAVPIKLGVSAVHGKDLISNSTLQPNPRYKGGRQNARVAMAPYGIQKKAESLCFVIVLSLVLECGTKPSSKSLKSSEISASKRLMIVRKKVKTE